MDNRRRAVIERYVQAVRFHGPGLLQLTREEQGDGGDSVMGFVFPHCKDINSASYFKNRLQISCPAVVDGQTWDDCKAGNHVEHGKHCGTKGRCPAQFEEKLHRFIATKADLVFGMQGKNQLQQSVGCGTATSQEVLKLYANPPPLETLMAVPVSVRRAELFKILRVGSIVLGEVTSKRPFGIFMRLTALEFSKHRELIELHVEALCRTTDLGGCAREYQDPMDAFVVGDKVRGVVSGVSAEEERISLSFRVSRLPPELENLQLGVIDETPSSDAARDLHYNEDKSYEDYLKSDVGFNNPRSVDTLIEELGIDEQAPCSLLRGFHRISYPEGDFAEALRKKQSAKWSMETTAKGVEHFKAGNHDAADKYFEHALQIDSENVEALVARGALAANRGQLAGAVKDFRRALTISGSHRNAHKYLTATLVEQGIQLEKEGDLEDALECFKEALGFDPGQDAAREHLKNVQQQINQRNQKKDKDAAKKQESASQFRHVRQLIKAEQNQAKKSKLARKKKKKGKSQKKKKKKIKSKSRRRSRRSSSSEQSSQDSSSSPTWVENAGAERQEKPGTGHRRTSGSSRRSGSEYSDDEEGHGRDMERGSLELRQSSNNAAGKGKAGRTRARSRSSSSSPSNKHETKDHVTRNKAKRKRSGSFDSPARLRSVSLSSDEDRSKNKQFSHKSRRTNRARRSYSFNSSDADKDDRARSRSRSVISGENRSRDRKTLPLKYKRKHRSRSRSTDSSNSRRDERARTRSRSPVRRALSSERRGRDVSPRLLRKRPSRSRSYSSSSNSSVDNKRTRHRSISREPPKKGSRR